VFWTDNFGQIRPKGSISTSKIWIRNKKETLTITNKKYFGTVFLNW